MLKKTPAVYGMYVKITLSWQFFLHFALVLKSRGFTFRWLLLPERFCTKRNMQELKVLETFNTIQLSDLMQIELLNRVDTKYVFHLQDLEEILEEIRGDYSVLEIDGKRMHAYETLYFDTPDFQLYRFHHSGRPNRLKVRFRKYADTGISFFEVKYKVKGSRTDKIRLSTKDILNSLGPKEKELIKHHQIDPDTLEQKLWVNFHRISIAKNDFLERATLDLGLRFKSNGKVFSYEDIVVAEIKQSKTSYVSPLIKALKSRHLEKSGFSKYVMGIATIYGLKANNFKPNFIKIDKIRNGRV
jgi:hypothetical protein